MKISWLGSMCVKIAGKQSTVIVDPYDPKATGLKSPSMKADVVLMTSDRPTSGNLDGVKTTEDVFVVKGAGEYEANGVFVHGLEAYKRQPKEDGEGGEIVNLYSFMVDRVHFVHLGDLADPLSDYYIDDLGDVDVLFVPVGGGSVMDTKEAVKLVNAIEPRVVIPVGFAAKGYKMDVESVEKFAKEMGVKEDRYVSDLSLVRRDLPQDETAVYVLEAQRAG